MQEFTLMELAAFDGQDGRPAYVSYNGTVYDVSDSPMWPGGNHEDQHKAGGDVTKEHERAPHDVYVTDFPEVGRLV
jgi:predicted heme/steroid binding protein